MTVSGVGDAATLPFWHTEREDGRWRVGTGSFPGEIPDSRLETGRRTNGPGGVRPGGLRRSGPGPEPSGRRREREQPVRPSTLPPSPP